MKKLDSKLQQLVSEMQEQINEGTVKLSQNSKNLNAKQE
jgi:hypothetical protein